MAVTVVLQITLLVAPIFLDFHPKFEVDLITKHRFDIAACTDTDFFQHFPAFADDDAFLASTIDDDGCVYVHFIIFIAQHRFHDDCHGMRHFFFGQLQDLFADEFGHDEVFRMVRHLIVRIELRSFRHVFFDGDHHFIDIVPLNGGNRNHFIKFIV
ncbi:hypothetical protein SDC9_171968 [bioreactor metagenome]|uniref:Uncharacterized protein n=1 Tax=bioreactor metagenome TaxID=1076179 RepID=A0A645GFK9_9ZZZZ